MATLYVTEYARLADDEPGRTIQAGQEPPIAEHTVSIGSGSDQTPVFNQSTRIVMVHTDSICHVAIGESPTASTEKRRLPADSTVFYGIPNASKFRLAVIEGV